jgi:hypothetical protein
MNVKRLRERLLRKVPQVELFGRAAAPTHEVTGQSGRAEVTMKMNRFVAAGILVGLTAMAGLAQAATVLVNIKNNTNTDYVVHVYDQFGGTQREVPGSPFALASKETSRNFSVNVSDTGAGKVMYECEGGPSKGDIAVADGSLVTVD